MGLREIESTLPPGFRFYPSDEELVCHYLYKKVTNERAAQGTLVEVDLHAREPWELPGEPLRPRSSSSLLFFFFLPADPLLGESQVSSVPSSLTTTPCLSPFLLSHL